MHVQSFCITPAAHFFIYFLVSVVVFVTARVYCSVTT